MSSGYHTKMIRHATSLKRSNFSPPMRRKLSHSLSSTTRRTSQQHSLQNRSIDSTCTSTRINKILTNSSYARNLGTSSSQLMHTLSFARYKHHIELRRSSEEAAADSQNVLACSPILNNQLQVSSESNIITNVIQKITSSAKFLWDVLMILFRTSEIGIRLSPLIVLTPAAILASSETSYVDHSNNEKKNYESNNNNNGTAIQKQEAQAKKSILSNIAWKYTLYTIQKLGPAFIKISQWASTRRDIFPSNVCDRLSELNDATFLHSWEHTHRVLTQTLGKDYESQLKVDKKDVIGSGSVAQVYSGFWDDSVHDEGNEEKQIMRRRRVAVKVLHPNIQYDVERDLLLMKRAANIIGEYLF